uniref:Uncharacterized protein n=1 Tax=Proboscia inermis TaxID=420281 RepID=A0A7S0C7Z8_9STRA
MYPLTTIKARIQASTTKADKPQPNNNSNNTNNNNNNNSDISPIQPFKRQFTAGKLYAGILPTLLLSVPASGLYFGIRDVTKRQLTRALITPSKQDDVFIALAGALIGKIISLAVQTPATAYSLRRQVATADDAIDDHYDTEEGRETTDTNWWLDSWGQLPAIIITDVPYLILRISLSLTLFNGDENIGQYELVNISVACFCAFVTTPFDVARTRILVDSDGDPSNGLDGGTMEGVWITMQKVMEEEGGGGKGLQNLFAGWLERVAYFGIGSAWLDPIRVLGYLGIRDAVLLYWFD